MKVNRKETYSFLTKLFGIITPKNEKSRRDREVGKIEKAYTQTQENKAWLEADAQKIEALELIRKFQNR